MNDIFGIPMNVIMFVLLAVLALCLLSVAWIALRRPIIFKLGARNIPRRKAQTILIVLGLMLSTLIIAAALGTGDTVSHSITSDVYTNLGQVDEVVVASQDVDASTDLTAQTTLNAAALQLVDAAVTGNADVDGVLPVLETRLAVTHEAGQLSEPDTIVTGLDASRLAAFGGLQATNGADVDLGALGPDEVAVTARLAGDLNAGVGDVLTLYVDDVPHQMTVAEVVKNTHLTGTRRSRNTDLEHSGMTMPLASLQALLGRPGEITGIAISNSGSGKDSVDQTDAVVSALSPALAGQGLGIDTIKQDRVDRADRLSTTFTQIFVLLGMFSVISGVLLIILIFTMLASERRTEMGIERAIGTHRRQLIQQFVSEGAVYALGAGLIGVALGALATFGIAEGMKAIFGQYATVEAHVTMSSLIIAYCLGMVITFLTVAISSWRISRINIVAAVRDIPDVVAGGRKLSTLAFAGLLVIIGGLLTLAGSSGSQMALFSIGMNLLPFGVALGLRYFRVPGRPLFTLVGLYVLTFWFLPEDTFRSLFGDFESGVEIFFLSGIFMVIGATIVIIQNSDLLLKGVSLFGGLFRSKLPAVRTAVAYPGAARGRTGLTIAMFSLIIFSLVMMSTMNHNYMESALGDEANAGWDVRADAITSEPLAGFNAALDAQGVDTGQFAAVGLVTNPSEYSSNLRISGADEWKTWPVQGVDQSFLEHSGLIFSQRAEGYASDSDIVQALLTQPNVAVIDAEAVPGEGDIGRDKSLLELTGLEGSDETFDPITVELQSPTGSTPYQVTIIGVIDSQVGSLNGLFASQKTVDAVYPAPAKASWYVALEDASRSGQVAKEIESALLQSGVQVSSIRDELRDAQREEGGFLMIIQGFMGLGLFVGVAAVGVIAFRSVVERRQQIGVLRAIGFQREMVSLSFMIETLFVVGLGVLTGTGLGLRLAQNLVQDPDQGFSQDVSFIIPWTTILPIITLTIVVALVMTWIPARQAGKIAPAEALRYE